MTDRTYCRAPGRKAHAFVTWTRMPGRARTLCNRNVDNNPELADRLRPDWRLCGRCARSIAAQTDVERLGPEDAFEPFGAPV